jgi:hypothetical protein
MQDIRAKRMPLFTLDEKWTDTNLTFKNSWQGLGIQGVMNTKSGNRLITVHVGLKEGLLPGAWQLEIIMDK